MKHGLFKRSMSLFLALVMILGNLPLNALATENTEGTTAPTCEHSYETVTTGASCTVGGKTTHTCTLCGESYDSDETEALGHSWDDGVETAATCTAEGKVVYTCTVCGDTDEQALATVAHSWDEGVEALAATCTAEGKLVYTCTVCGGTDEQALAVIAHAWDEGVEALAATCTAEGKLVYTCTVCGGTDEQALAVIAHAWDDGVVTTEATCTAAGKSVHTCTVCGGTEERAVEATGHTWGQWEVTTAATLDAVGQETRTCGVCGAQEQQEIARLVREQLSGDTRKIYFLNTENWEKVYAAWSFDKEDFYDIAFPGEEMEDHEELENVYVIELPVEADDIRFNDGVEVTEELLAWEAENGGLKVHEYAAELHEELDYFDANEQVAQDAGQEEVTEWLSQEEILEAHYAAEVAAVQAMIDALPTSFDSEEAVNTFWDVTAAQLDAAIESLNYEQQEQLNTAKYDAAIDAAAAFANPEFDKDITWEVDDWVVLTEAAAPTVPEDIAVGGTVTGNGTDDAPVGTIPTGTHWDGPVKGSTSCGMAEHTHTDDCYDKVLSCGHAHTKACYSDEEKCSGYSGFGKKCTTHKYHWTESGGYIPDAYGANTLNCAHNHIAYGQTNSCYTIGDLGVGCSTRSWRNGNVLEGDLGGWQFYQHAHDDVTCYTYTWTLAWNKYTITWDVDGTYGDAQKVTKELPYGTTVAELEAAAPEHAGVSGYSPNGWAPAFEVVTKDQEYVAQFSQDIVYTVKFYKNQGDTEQYGETQLVNATKGQVVTLPTENPDQDNAIFVKWITDGKLDANNKPIGETLEINIYADWNTNDANNNNIDDGRETITINIDIDSNCTYEISGAVRIGETNNWVFDSNSGKVTITAAGKDSGKTDVKYVPSMTIEDVDKTSPAEITVANGNVIDVYITCTEVVLNAKNGDLVLNMSLSDASEHLAGLKDKVLTAAKLPAGDYTVTTTVTIDKVGTVSLQVNNDGIVVMGDWGRLQDLANRLAPTALAADLRLSGEETEEKTKAFTITDNATGLSKTVTHTLKEERLAAVIGDLTYTTASFDTEAQFKAAVEAAIKANIEDAAGKKIEPTVTFDYTKNDDGTYNVKATVWAGSTWLDAERTFNNIAWTVNQYNVTFVDENGTTVLKAAKAYDYGTAASEIEKPADPTKASDAQYHYSFAGWDPEIAQVTADATYKATYEPTLRQYTVQYVQKLADGTTKVWQTSDVDYGSAIPGYDAANGTPEQAGEGAVQYSHNGWKLTEGTVGAGNTVAGPLTYEPTFSTDTVYTITFKVGGEIFGDIQYINVTENKTAVVADPGKPDVNNEIEGKIFTGWDADIIGKTPASNMTVNAVLVDEKNDNNVLDSEETATIKVEITSDVKGKVALSDELAKTAIITTPGTADGTGEYTILFDSADNHSEVITVTATPDDTDGSDGSVGYVVSAPTTVTVKDGANDPIQVAFGTHTLTVADERNLSVNGHTDTKLAAVTKKAVLEAILGKTLTPAEVEQYDVKMYVEAKYTVPIFGNEIDLSDYHDIWDLSKIVELGNAAVEAFKIALKEAIDVPGTEKFEVTWNEPGKPAVTVTGVEVQLTESRKPTEVIHNVAEDHVYSASELDEELLKEIRGNLKPNTTIVSVEWAEEYPALTAGETRENIKLKITVTENAEYYGTTHEVTVTVKAPYTNATIKIPESTGMTYNSGMPVADKTAMVLEAVKPEYTPKPQEGDKVEPVVWYLASEARDVPMTINLSQMDLGVVGMFLPDVITVDVPVEELWLNIGDDLTIPEKPSNERLEEIILDQLIPAYGSKFISGELSEAELMQAAAEVLANNPDVAEYYKLMGAHAFGENEKIDANGNILETVYVAVSNYTVGGTNFGNKKSENCVLTLSDLRQASSVKLNSGVSVVYNSYTESSLLAEVLNGVVDASGAPIAGAEATFETDVVGLPVGTHEVTVKFNGNEDYKSSEATTTITITKAPVQVIADHRMIHWSENLSYKLPLSTSPAGVDMITFVAGLDISSVNMNGAEVNGILGSVQLLLPEGLQNLLVMADDMISAALGREISFADGASMKLSDLKAAADALQNVLQQTEFAAYTDTLVMILEKLPTEVADIEIRIGGNLPTNIGAYLVGGVTADANYETAVNAAVVVITPDGIKTEIGWVNPDENNIFTQTLLTGNYLDAQVVSVADGNKAAAEAQIVELFLGINVDGTITLSSDETALNVGAYAEVALVANWGNQMYYSNILARPVVVIAESLNVDFVDGSGAVNNERLVEFDNTTKNLMEGNLMVTYKQGANAGSALSADQYNVKYLYVGTQTNGMPYAKAEAPTHAGVYAVTAIVTVRDGGKITHAGVGHGLLTITPTESDISVGNKAVKYDGEYHGLSDEIVATSGVPGLTPDTTIISAGLSADLNDVTGLEAINGNVNVDMPKWLDELFAKYDILEAGYAEGVSADTFLGYIAKLEEILAELNVEIEALNEIVDFVKQIPVTTNLTFHDNASYKEIGAYLYVGIVTDSDHYPSAGAGILVIYPDATKVELRFEEDWNNNNIFTWNTLKTMDLEASAYLNGALHEAATDKVVDLYFGFTDNGEFLLEAVTQAETIEDAPEFDNGVYTQLSMLLDLSNKPYYAEPISRVFIIAPNKVAVEFVDESGNINDDRHFVFDNQPHAMAVSVNGVKMAPGEHEGGKKLEVLYVGVQTNGKTYSSTEAPVHSGAYTVTAVYTEKDSKDRYVTLGNALGAMVIEPAKADIAVDNAAYEWHKDLKVNVTDQITVSHNVAGITSPDTTIITAGIATDGTFSENGLNAINTDINIDFPAWADEVIAKIDGLEDGMTVAELTAIIDKVDAAVSEYEVEGYELEIFDKLKNVLNQLPADKHVTFTDAEDLEFSAVGTYLVVGIVTDSDFYPAIDAGVLLIYPDVNEVTLDWIYKDSNNIFTKDTLKVVDLGAKVVEENITAEPGVLFLGVEAETFEIVLTNDQKALNIGVYDEIGYLIEVGSVSYYAKPIDRVISVVAGGLDMIFVDETGSKNHDRLFTYDGKQHSMETVVVSYMQDLDGRSDVILDTSKQSNDGNLSFYYTGVQTNGAVYASKTAPTEAGTYTVTATYVLRDAQSGLVTHVGAAVGVLAIEPAEATITVAEKLHKYDGQSVAIADMISVTSENGLKPDTTIISAQINTDGSFSEEGLKALTGNINIDFPAWVDEILTKVHDYNEIVVAQLIEEIEAVEAIVSQFEIEGHELEIFDNLKTVLSQMDQNAKVTFKDTDELAYSAVGTYMVVGVVTDSNYYPAMDAGVLVIYPNVELGTLEWKNVDKNNIFYLDSLTSGYLDAKALFEGVEDATVDPTEIYIGVDADNWLIHLSTQQPDSVGVYTEIAVLNDTNSNAHYAMPIMRPVIVVDGIYDVLFHDENGNVNHDRLFTYDGTAKEIGKVYVYGYDKGFYQDAVPAEDELKILYIGTDSTGDGWMREEAPTDAGVYSVVATYIDYENGKVVGGGAGVGTMIIEKADMALDMKDTTVTYDGNGHFVDVTSEADDPDYLTVIVDKNENTINFILEDDLTIAGGVFKTLLEKALGRELADNAFNVTEVQQAIHKVIDEIETFEIPERVMAAYDQLPDTLKKAIADLKSSTYEPVKAKVDEVLALIQNEIPQSGTVIFNGDLPKNVGEYQFYGFALSENYEPQATQGVLTIKPVQIEVTAENMTKVYGEADPELTYTVQYFDHEGNELTNISTDVAVEISRAAGEDVGEYAITATVENGNYEIATVSGTLTITPKAITVKIDDKEKFVGDEDPQFTATYDGMVGSDTLSITFSREQGETAGDYAITATVAENKNYTVTVVPGTLTIKEKAEDDQKTGFQIIIEEPNGTIAANKVVEIDGVEYQLDEDGELWIPEENVKQWQKEGTKLLTSYVYKEDASDVHKEYPTAMYVWVLTYDTKTVDNAVVINAVTAVRIKELDNYLMYEGTSIRINFVNDAIRFFTSVTPGGYSGLKNGTLLSNTGTALDGAKMLEMGTRAKKFNAADPNLTIAHGAGDIVFGANANADGKATDGLRKYGDGTRYVTKEACYLFTGAMENLPTSKENLNLEFVVRPYVTLQLQNGQTTTLYGGKYQRTISYVAYQNQSFMAGTDYNAYIQKIISISGIDPTTGKIS